MSDHERDLHSSRDEPPLAFDPRRPVRGAGPAPITLIVSGLILIGLIAVAAFVYRGGVRHADQPPAPVGEPLTDIKTPAPPEAADNAAAGLSIYRSNAAPADSNAVPTLAPAPEQPLPVVAAAPPVSPQPLTAPPPPPPVQAVQAPAPKAPAKTLTLAGLEDAAEAKNKPAKPAPPPPAPAAPAPGAAWVQIGALSSPALADRAWNDVARLAPGPMLGKGKKVETVSRDGKTLYRTYVTGFSNRDQAQAFCVKLIAAGKSCLVK